MQTAPLPPPGEPPSNRPRRDRTSVSKGSGCGRRMLVTPRVPAYELDKNLNSDEEETENGAGQLAEAGLAPELPQRVGHAEALKHLMRKDIEKEYTLHELRASRLKNIESQNARAMVKMQLEEQKQSIAEFYANQRFIYEQRSVSTAPDQQLRPESDIEAYKRAHETRYAHKVVPGEPPAPWKAPDVCLPPVPPLTPSVSSGSEEEEDVLDPLEDDLVWQSLKGSLQPGELEEAHFKRMQEIQAAKREAQRLYTAGIQAELAKEEYHVQVLTEQLRHRKEVEKAWKQEVSTLREEWVRKEVHTSLEQTEQLQRELNLIEKKVAPPPRITQEEKSSQVDNWNSLFTTENVPVQIHTRKESDEVRRWIASWRDETDEHHVKATKIQCSWRCHSARCKVRRTKWLKCVHQRALLESEERREQEYEQLLEDLRWGRTRNGEQRLESAVEILGRFGVVCVAKIKKDRTKQKRYHITVKDRRAYAALRIQTAFRAMQARRRSYILRHPDEPLWWHDSFLAKFCITIQRCARGWEVRRRLKIQQAAAVRLQCAVRQHLSKRKLHQLQRRASLVKMKSRKGHATLLIQRNARRYFRFGSRPVTTVEEAESDVCVEEEPSEVQFTEEPEVQASMSLSSDSKPCAALTAMEFRRMSTLLSISSAGDPCGTPGIGSTVVLHGFRGGDQMYNDLRGVVVGRRSTLIGVHIPNVGKMGFKAKHIRVLSDFDTMQDEAAVVIQCMVRRRIAQKIYATRSRENTLVVLEIQEGQLHHAAEVIQAAFRIPVSRRKLRDAKSKKRNSHEAQLLSMKERERDNAAQAIQCCWKGHTAWKQSQRVREAQQDIQRNDVRIDAATCLQSAWRRYLARSTDLKEQQILLNHIMAQTIINFFRIHVSAKVKTSVLAKHQAVGERKLAYRSIVMSEAALLLQSWWRGTHVRRFRAL